MPGRVKCQPGCDCEKHSRPRMSLEERRAAARVAASKHYEAHREEILGRQRQQRRDPVTGEAKRARERARRAAMTEEERARERAMARDWYRRNPRSNAENVRQHLRHRYGLTPERCAEMLAAQDGCCYLCGEPLPEDTKKIHIDHDHACCRGSRSCGDCIRGLACEGCNTGIGCFGDDPERMRRVADQLEAANARAAAQRAAKPVQAELPLNVTPIRVAGRQ